MFRVYCLGWLWGFEGGGLHKFRGGGWVIEPGAHRKAFMYLKSISLCLHMDLLGQDIIGPSYRV